MANRIITYKWTNNYNESVPDNGYFEERHKVILGNEISFLDWVRESCYDSGFYDDGRYEFLADNDDDPIEVIITFDDKPTGERYFIVSDEPTDMAIFV